MIYIAKLYIVFGQIPHPVVSVTKDGAMKLNKYINQNGGQGGGGGSLAS